VPAHHRRNNTARRLLGWTLNLTLLAIVLMCVGWIAPSALGYSRYVITGGSMTGSIDKGSVVFEKPVPVEELEVGDVITYQPPAGAGTQDLVTHRIIAMEPAEGGGTLFTTQGDANPHPDPWHFKLVDQDQAVVLFSVPHAGWVFIALADRTTRLALIGGPAALIALAALAQLLGALRPDRRQEETDPVAADTETAVPVLV
jgi:signal peptidase